MADHIIECTEITGVEPITSELYSPYSNTDWIIYTYPSAYQTVIPETRFIVKFKRPVDLTLLDTTNFKLEKVLTENPTTVTEITNAFEDIDTIEDYDSVSRTLVLKLNEDLDTLSTYYFTISDLVDTTGAAQVDDNILIFETSSSGEAPVIPDPVDIDTVIIEDYTLSSPPVPSGFTSSLVTCSIISDSLNVSVLTSEITLSFDSLVNTSNIYITEENLQAGTIVNFPVTVEQDSSTFLVTISLTNLGTEDSPYYLNANCIYTINAIYTTIEFATPFSPFYVTIGAFAPFTTAAAADPITWARIIYEFSCEVRDRMGSSYTEYEANKLEAIRQFTKYSILSSVESYGINDSFLLGELQVSTGQNSNRSSGGYSYKELANMWETKLFGRSNVVKTADPFVPRYDNRIGETRLSKYFQDLKTFNRKLY